MKSSALDYTRFEVLKDCVGYEFLKNEAGDLVIALSRRTQRITAILINVFVAARLIAALIISLRTDKPYLEALDMGMLDGVILLLAIVQFLPKPNPVITHEGLFKPIPAIKATQIVWISRRRTWTGRHRVILQTNLREYLLAEFLDRRSAERFEQIIREYLVGVGHPAGLELYPRLSN